MLLKHIKTCSAEKESNNLGGQLIVVGDQKTLLRDGLEKLKLDLTARQKEQLKDFLESVLSENKKFNLTGIKEPKEATIKHLFDSLSMASEINAHSIADVGSGAGFPGIPLAIDKDPRKPEKFPGP